MKRTVEWDRRRFLQLMASTSSLGIAGSRFGWAVSLAAPARKANFAYIGAEREIHVYSIAADEHFISQQTIFSAHPVAMAISGGNLYVATVFLNLAIYRAGAWRPTELTRRPAS